VTALGAGGSRRLPRTVRRRLHAPEAQAVTFVELFFDLVFVFAVTQVTALTADHLTWSGIARSLLLFWLIWWAWTQFTWTLNPADTDHAIVRVCTLVATGAAFLMAASTTQAFGADVLWFVGPYLAVRILGLGLQLRIDQEHPDGQGTVYMWVTLSLVGLVLVLAGAFVDPPARNWIWLAAIFADLFAAANSNRGRGAWDLHADHFTERHGLFVIIALGESLIVAAAAVSSHARTGALMTDVIGALVVASLLWWTYFGWLKESLEHGMAAAPPAARGPVARDAFSLGHFPLVCGIIGFAVYVHDVVARPSGAPDGDVVAALGAGVALFVGMSAFAYWRTNHRILAPRLALLAATLVVLGALHAEAPYWQLGAVAVGLFAIVLVERHEPADARQASERRRGHGDLPLQEG
jgi:low temperature requirement protein LtrA